MAKHYSQKPKKGGGSMMMPRDAASAYSMGDETQMYHMGKSYYGPGYGHPSNLPPDKEMSQYPKDSAYLHNRDYPDTVREIDSEDVDNLRNLNRQPSKSKY